VNTQGNKHFNSCCCPTTRTRSAVVAVVAVGAVDVGVVGVVICIYTCLNVRASSRAP